MTKIIFSFYSRKRRPFGTFIWCNKLLILPIAVISSLLLWLLLSYLCTGSSLYKDKRALVIFRVVHERRVYSQKIAKKYGLKARFECIRVCGGFSNIDAVVANGIANKFDGEYFFKTLLLFRPDNTSRILILLHFHNAKTIIHFCKMFDKIMMSIQCQNPLKFCSTSSIVRRNATTVRVVDVWIFLNRLLHYSSTNVWRGPQWFAPFLAACWFFQYILWQLRYSVGRIREFSTCFKLEVLWVRCGGSRMF